jgi:LysR family hydrogen peroxide-inducible transcriptional activator
LRQLRYLVALEDTHHFREAAESCGISQPSLSVQIKTLEEALDQTLVERGRGPVRLTMAGREVARRGREMLDAAQGILDLSVTLKSGLAGTIRMGTSATLGPYLMPHVVGDLHRSHPDLRLYIREAAPRDLMRQLNDGSQDLILTQLPVTGAAFHVARLFREPLWCDARRPPARQKGGARQRGPGRPDVLSLSPAYTLHEQISALCDETGAQLSRDYEGTSLDALRQMAAMGMGLTFLPALYVRSEIDARPAGDVLTRPFRGRRFSRSIGLVWRKNSGAAPAFDRLADTIRETARRFPELVIES